MANNIENLIEKSGGTAQAAAKMGVSRQTIHAWCKDGGPTKMEHARRLARILFNDPERGEEVIREKRKPATPYQRAHRLIERAVQYAHAARRALEEKADVD